MSLFTSFIHNLFIFLFTIDMITTTIVKGKKLCYIGADTYRAPNIFAPQQSDALE